MENKWPAARVKGWLGWLAGGAERALEMLEILINPCENHDHSSKRGPHEYWIRSAQTPSSPGAAQQLPLKKIKRINEMNKMKMVMNLIQVSIILVILKKEIKY